MDTIAIYTQAHNAEKTLIRTIKSVLNQTYKNFLYYIGDNCSTDGTRKIIMEYAAKDKRIIPVLYNGDGTNVDNIVTNLMKSYNLIAGNTNVDYFCVLDADDIYHENFFEKSLDFLKKNNLDIVATGSNFIDTETKKIIGTRAIKENLVLFDWAYSEYLPFYHCFMRTVWGKLYKTNCFRRMLNEGLPVVSYGLDTVFAFKTLKYSNRAGILKGTFHDYYVSKKSSSYIWFPNRENSCEIINNQVIEFLISKSGIISENNRSFLDQVYLNDIADTIDVLNKCDKSESDKLRILKIIIENKTTISALNNENINLNFRRCFLDVILKSLSLYHEAKTTPDGIWLGMNVSALAENQESYIEYSICNISYLININNLDMANSELNEWERILPGNNKLKDLRRKLNEKCGEFDGRKVFIQT